MITKHTPGPWHIKSATASGFKTKSGGNGIYAPARPTDDFFILQIASMETNLSGQEVEANARLIAAAPELLEAAIYLMDDLRHSYEPRSAALDKIEAAIAKATGEAQ